MPPSTWAIRWAWSPSTWADSDRSGLAAKGSVAATMPASNLPATGERSSSAVHRPWVSLVQASAVPRPYCHCARMGSLAGPDSTTWAAGLGVEAT